jgi:D-alanyl-D-alanine carboxypeptidase (penicillin-binding protein 5/6)
MRYKLFISLLSLCIVSALNAAPSLVPSPPQLKAKAWLMVDYNSNRILAEHNSSMHVEPASLTKVMTGYVVLRELANKSISMDDQVLISKKAWQMKGSLMFIEVDTRVSVEDLLKGMIIQSGNDASVALAEHVAGSEDAFVQLMNQYADTLGMKETHFENSTGWPSANHYTTAHDLAILSRALINDFPEHYSWYKEKIFKYNNIKQNNRNRLLWIDERVDGIKTGHTESAGYCLVTSAKQNDMRLITVVLGADSDKSRSTSSRMLLNYGFRFYLYLTLPRGQRNKITANMSHQPMLMAPANIGQTYGTVNIKLKGYDYVSRPLVALEDIAEGGLWRKLVDSIILLFN